MGVGSRIVIYSVYTKRDVDGTIIDHHRVFTSSGEVQAQRTIEDILPGHLVAFEVLEDG